MTISFTTSWRRIITLLFILFIGINFSATAQISIDSDTTSKEAFYGFPDIDFEIEKINKYLKNNKPLSLSSKQVSLVDTNFRSLVDKINIEINEFDNYNHKNLSKFFLINTYRIWSGYKTQLKAWQSYIYETLSTIEKQTLSVSEKEKKWKATLDKLTAQNIPLSFKDKIKKVLKEIKKLEKDNYRYSIRLITLENDITDQLAIVDNVISEVVKLQENYRANLFSISDPTIWNISLKGTVEGSISERLSKAWYENTKSFKNNADAYLNNLITLLLIFLVFMALLIILRFRFLKKFDPDINALKHDITLLFISRPKSSLLSLFILFFFINFQNIPLALAGIMTLTLLTGIYIAMNPYLKDTGKTMILRFIILVALNNLEILFWYFGNYSRVFISFEAILGILFTYQFINRKFSMNTLPKLRFKKIIYIIRYPVFILFIIAFLSNIFGFLNLAVLCLKIGSQLTGAIIITLGLWHITLSIINVLVELIAKNKQLKFLHYIPLFKKRLTQFFGLVYLYLLLLMVLNILEFRVPFDNMLDQFLDQERNVANVTFTYLSVFNFIISILLTWGLYSLVGIIFDSKNFKKSQSLRGVPDAIATTLRIIIGTIGVLIAFSAAGLDMAKLGIIMGALSVGIGFGLQNVVNNFISGLILIYERPVQVGDVVEVGNLMGEIKSIGIRASNIRTYDGSEVIVPNSNLVSDQLINWTLSDDHRRLEIIVGVAYGTDPNLVIRVLKEVALANPKVVRFPEPFIMFNEFGDSSLNFRMLFWVLFENGLSTRSEVSIAIDKAFKENNIEIPFPQMDLHMKDPKKKRVAEKKEITEAPEQDMKGPEIMDDDD